MTKTTDQGTNFWHDFTHMCKSAKQNILKSELKKKKKGTCRGVEKYSLLTLDIYVEIFS